MLFTQRNSGTILKHVILVDRILNKLRRRGQLSVFDSNPQNSERPGLDRRHRAQRNSLSQLAMTGPVEIAPRFAEAARFVRRTWQEALAGSVDICRRHYGVDRDLVPLSSNPCFASCLILNGRGLV